MGSKLDALMAEINKELKSEVAHHGLAQSDYKRIPFTSPQLNHMSYGGLPMGKLIEFYGEEHGGKTTTALDIVANYQRMEGAKAVIYADCENTLDTVWGTKLGVDFDRDDMWLIHPTNQSAEKLFEYMLQMIDTGEVGLIVIDSLGVMVSKQALEKSVEEKTYGGIATALTNFSRKAEMLCNKHNCTLIGINQMRMDMNSMYGGTTTTGGLAWKHNCTVRMEFRHGKFFDDKYRDLASRAENPVGNYVQVYMTKNKTCPPTRHTGFYTIRYDVGIDYLYDLTEVGMRYGVIEQAGAWFTVIDPDTGEILAKTQGQKALYEYLTNPDNESVLKFIEDYIEARIDD